MGPTTAGVLSLGTGGRRPRTRTEVNLAVRRWLVQLAIDGLQSTYELVLDGVLCLTRGDGRRAAVRHARCAWRHVVVELVVSVTARTAAEDVAMWAATESLSAGGVFR